MNDATNTLLKLIVKAEKIGTNPTANILEFGNTNGSTFDFKLNRNEQSHLGKVKIKVILNVTFAGNFYPHRLQCNLNDYSSYRL